MKILQEFLFSHMRGTCLASLILCDVIILIRIDQFSYYGIFHLTFTLSVSHPNISASFLTKAQSLFLLVLCEAQCDNNIKQEAKL